VFYVQKAAPVIWSGNCWWREDQGLISIGMLWPSSVGRSEVFCIELPEPGEVIGEGSIFCSVHTLAKTLFLSMPVTGRIIAVNDELESNPRIVEVDPFVDGWLVKAVTSLLK